VATGNAPGDGGVNGVPAGPRPRGWNIMPVLNGGANRPFQNSFYLYTNDGNATGVSLYPSGDFNRLFILNDEPT
jgi:hypothetical protein